MEKRGVRVFFGTMERANELLVDVALQDPAVAPLVKGVGFQWAGKGAIAGIHRRYPHLPLYQTEQECGDGKNDWRYCRYAWTLAKHYLRSGANAYHYWNKISSIGSYITAIGTVIFFIGVIHAMMRKQRTVDNPWGEGATTLEWTLPSPPPFHQFETLPRIKSGDHH